MDLSVFLAKLLGLYLLIITAIWLVRKKGLETTVKEICSSKGVLALSAVFNILFGLVIVIDHEFWEWSWRGLITVLGYVILLKGVMRFAFPSQMQRLATRMITKGYWTTLVIMGIIGIYLTYSGFAH